MKTLTDHQARFEDYLAKLATAIGHADRREPLRAYLSGLLLPVERKSVEPMAAKIDPKRLQARHQSMHHFVAKAPWEGGVPLQVARNYALEALERHGPIQAWVVDDTGIPKKGRHSVGVARQYCGQLGKQEDCQVAVSISLVCPTQSVPAAYRLYLPECWASDAKRRRAARVPRSIRFRKKWRIALEEMDRLGAEEVPRAPVLADGAYGMVTEFREELTRRGFSYAVNIPGDLSFWAPGESPLPPKRWSGQGRPPSLLRRDARHKPRSAEALIRALPAETWKTVQWREGTQGSMKSRFVALRVCPAHRDCWRRQPFEPEWLLAEWPFPEKTPAKYWLSTVPENTPLEDLVRLAKLRWRIERDYEEMKGEVGLTHYEGRGWAGFHHHGVLCIAAYAFLAAERARLSPPEPVAFLKAAKIPKGFRPRGAPVAA